MASNNQDKGEGMGSGKRQHGFTLIELMIVVVVIGILAAIAYASYQNSVVNSRRAAASACLMEAAQFMERYYTTNMTYADAEFPNLGCSGELAAFYEFDFNGDPTATVYVLEAVAQGQQQARDERCGDLGLNQAGVRTASGTAGAAACW